MHKTIVGAIGAFGVASILGSTPSLAQNALLAPPAFGADYSFELLPGQAPFSIATGINNHGIVVGLCRGGACVV
jgi:hypothetical protein